MEPFLKGSSLENFPRIIIAIQSECFAKEHQCINIHGRRKHIRHMAHKFWIQTKQTESKQTAKRCSRSKCGRQQLGKFLRHLIIFDVAAFESYNLNNYSKNGNTQHKGSKHEMQFRDNPDYQPGIQPKKPPNPSRARLFFLNSSSCR